MKLRLPASPFFWTALSLGAAMAAIVACRPTVPPKPVAAVDYAPVDTQPSGQPLPPDEAVKRFRLPDGFQVTLAAAEPEVRQPIAVSFDDRGRLWVAESYSYDGSNFTTEQHDRILIFEDRDGDGVFESRKVFHDRLNRLTGLLWGFGGVWVATAPTLSFIPDADGDDRPDSEPVIHLDGWTLKAEHNSVNGLSWGPDGWLYGRHGIKEPSRPGRPGTPDAERPEVSCGIWRYHPTRHVFEPVADGTINPWGLDYDEHGQWFMNTSVVDHLWHVVPGAHFARWPDRPGTFHPHVYELMEATSDHSHRPVARPDPAGTLPGEDGSGGGHSHADVMIYLGDRWPEEYRGAVFMNNIMGRRVNRERLVRAGGAGRFVARHDRDFLSVDDPWFRGISLQYGPDGDAILTDWSDYGECHDRDGVHRRSGRIYKISYGAPRRVEVDLGRATDAELVASLTHRNEWFARHARRLLQERAHAGADLTAMHTALREMFTRETAVPRRLRALWALYATGGATPAWLASLLGESDENLRYWAVRLLTDAGAPPPGAATSALVTCAEVESSWLVRMALASALGVLGDADRWELGSTLARRTSAGEDANLVRLLWNGWHPSMPSRPEAALALAAQLDHSRLRQWLPRRLAEDAAARPDLLTPLLAAATAAGPAQIDLMVGFEAGLGNHGQAVDAGAVAPLQTFYATADPVLRRAALLLGARLRDTAAVDQLRHFLSDTEEPAEARVRVLNTVAPLHPDWLVGDLLALIGRGELVGPALRALAASSDPRIAPALLDLYSRLDRGARATAIDTLVARAPSLQVLLDAIAAGRVAKADISQLQAQQALRVADDVLRHRFEDVWGTLRTSSGTVAAQLRKYRAIFNDQEFLRTADIARGRVLFEERCAVCHTLFDRGGKLGPDLTGSGRKDLEYLLINIIDPNAAIPADFRLAVATLKDGQVVSGSVAAENDATVTLQTITGAVVIDRANLASLERLKTSLMPTGIVDDLTAEQVRDLFAFLMSDAGAH